MAGICHWASIRFRDWKGHIKAHAIIIFVHASTEDTISAHKHFLYRLWVCLELAFKLEVLLPVLKQASVFFLN